jgi:hypothetical protein
MRGIWVSGLGDVRALNLCHVYANTWDRHCSERCQEKDWSAHRKDCNKLNVELVKAKEKGTEVFDSLGTTIFDDGAGEAARNRFTLREWMEMMADE